MKTINRNKTKVSSLYTYLALFTGMLLVHTCAPKPQRYRIVFIYVIKASSCEKHAPHPHPPPPPHPTDPPEIESVVGCVFTERRCSRETGCNSSSTCSLHMHTYWTDDTNDALTISTSPFGNSFLSCCSSLRNCILERNKNKQKMRKTEKGKENDNTEQGNKATMTTQFDK